METKKSKYDTNPLDPDVERKAEEVWGDLGGSGGTGTQPIGVFCAFLWLIKGRRRRVNTILTRLIRMLNGRRRKFGVTSAAAAARRRSRSVARLAGEAIPPQRMPAR